MDCGKTFKWKSLMDRILISLPVHERPDIVRDQIENIQYFCPNAIVCIHVSNGANDDISAFERACDLPGVIVNPRRYDTIYSKGILHTHISNFECAVIQGIEFDKVMLLSSNEMLVKPGLPEHVSRFELGAQTEAFDLSIDWHVFHRGLLQDVRIKGFLQELGLPTFFGGQAEGQFFSREIFTFLHGLYTRHFPMAPGGFETEEVLPATIAGYYSILGKDATLPVSLCDYCTLLKVDTGVVDVVRRGTGSLVSMKYPRALRSPHHNASTLAGAFSVKRVPREDCDLRRYIRGLEQVSATAPA